MKRQNICIRISHDALMALDDLAQIEERSRSQVAARLIRKGLGLDEREPDLRSSLYAERTGQKAAKNRSLKEQRVVS